MRLASPKQTHTCPRRRARTLASERRRLGCVRLCARASLSPSLTPRARSRRPAPRLCAPPVIGASCRLGGRTPEADRRAGAAACARTCA
eukprot:5915933-Pleurochrysis_carterae.AAC.1